MGKYSNVHNPIKQMPLIIQQAERSIKQGIKFTIMMHFLQGNKTIHRCNVVWMSCYLITLNCKVVVLMRSKYGALVKWDWQRKAEIFLTWPDLELKPWLHSDRPVAICLSNDTSLLQYMIIIILTFVEEPRHFSNAACNECVHIFFLKKS
jgi:hypothetical protein